MAAEPLEARAVGNISQTKVLNPIVNAIPNFNPGGSQQVMPGAVGGGTTDIIHDTRDRVIPGETLGTAPGAPLIFTRIFLPETSPFGRFRQEVTDGPEQYQYNDRPGTPLPVPYKFWDVRRYNVRYFQMGIQDFGQFIDYLYPDGIPDAVTYYRTPSELNNEVAGLGNTPEMPLGMNVVDRIAPWENELINPNIGSGGSGSARPEDGLLYPRKV